MFSLCSARWIGNHGFSFGVNDVDPGDRISTQKKLKIEKGYDSCTELISKYWKTKLASQPGSDAAELVEAEITGVLNQIRDITGDVSFLFSIIRFINNLMLRCFVNSFFIISYFFLFTLLTI